MPHHLQQQHQEQQQQHHQQQHQQHQQQQQQQHQHQQHQQTTLERHGAQHTLAQTTAYAASLAPALSDYQLAASAVQQHQQAQLAHLYLSALLERRAAAARQRVTNLLATARHVAALMLASAREASCQQAAAATLTEWTACPSGALACPQQQLEEQQHGQQACEAYAPAAARWHGPP
ncbi:hypothetical protein D9Q98_001221 [Chlorella vulgaris]|uniref:Uncharacterized protein n=1 Tax=Chlorella vulgaris TaxID=3077 RepID=A0A9D4Z2F9_CHLVU|nr:hypothetical protein D9Q98_001221 [Chlorella vulgaris]